MRILLTGASSFTGAWFARALLNAGHEVIAPLRRPLSDYEPLRRLRTERLVAGARIVEGCPLGTDKFLQLVRETGPFDAFCHHAAEVTNYRSADFDFLGAARANTLMLKSVFDALRSGRFSGVVATGSVFECDEGKGEAPGRAFSPYGLSKSLTWQIERYFCESTGMRLAKFVIPNPFGAHEEPRFTTSLIRSWAKGETPTINTPDYVRDNIPVDLLASCYARWVERLPTVKAAGAKLDPSGYVESQGKFAERFAREMRSRLGLECRLQLNKQTEFAEPLTRHNTTPASKLCPDWSESRFWDEAAEYYQRNYS